MNDTARLKTAKTCVIVSDIQAQITFFRGDLGEVVNGGNVSQVPEVKRMTDRVLKEEIARHYQVKETLSLSAGTKKSDSSAAIAAAKRNGADLIVDVRTWSSAPPGTFRGMDSDGFGYYGGFAQGKGTIVCHVGLDINDPATGKMVASPHGENDLGLMVDADTFSKERHADRTRNQVLLSGGWKGKSYSEMNAQQKQELMTGLEKLFRAKVKNDLWKMELR